MAGNHCGQLCNKPSKAGTSSSVVPVRRHVKGYASASREACSVQLYVLVVDTATASLVMQNHSVMLPEITHYYEANLYIIQVCSIYQNSCASRDFLLGYS